MALEIERRFLVRGDAWRAHIAWQAQLQQGYLSASAEGVTVRVRRNGSQSWLTIKARATAAQGSGASSTLGLDWVRQEFEYEIPVADAEQMLSLAPVQLSKRRYGLDLPGGDWVLDVFEDSNTPLVIAEVELSSPDQPVVLPTWCVQEITGQGRFSNAALAASPLASWSADARQQTLLRIQSEAGMTR